MSEKNKPAKALPTLRRSLALNVRLRMKRGKAKALVTLIVFMLPLAFAGLGLALPAVMLVSAFSNLYGGGARRCAPSSAAGATSRAPRAFRATLSPCCSARACF